MLPFAIIGYLEWLLILVVLLLLFGAPLLIAGVVLGSWLRRTGRLRAFRTYVSAALCAAVAALSLIGAIALTVAVRSHASAQTEYLHRHPLALILLVGLWGIVVLAGLACVLFGAWTAWRLIEAPPAQPLRTTPPA